MLSFTDIITYEPIIIGLIALILFAFGFVIFIWLFESKPKSWTFAYGLAFFGVIVLIFTSIMIISGDITSATITPCNIVPPDASRYSNLVADTSNNIYYADAGITMRLHINQPVVVLIDSEWLQTYPRIVMSSGSTCSPGLMNCLPPAYGLPADGGFSAGGSGGSTYNKSMFNGTIQLDPNVTYIPV